jgi:hypothetical protein
MNARHARPAPGAAHGARILQLLLAFLLSTGLAACTGPGGRLVHASEGIRVLDLEVDSSLDWARVHAPRTEVWTIDGLPLNEFVVVSRVRDHEHVMLDSRERKHRPDGPWFRAGMRPDELRDVLLDAFRQDGWTRVAASGLRPARFGNVDGIRFEAELTEPGGLRYKAMFGAAEHNGRLTHFFWIAPEEHYFPRDRAAVEHMFDTLRFVDG